MQEVKKLRDTKTPTLFSLSEKNGIQALFDAYYHSLDKRKTKVLLNKKFIQYQVIIKRQLLKHLKKYIIVIS